MAKDEPEKQSKEQRAEQLNNLIHDAESYISRLQFKVDAARSGKRYAAIYDPEKDEDLIALKRGQIKAWQEELKSLLDP